MCFGTIRLVAAPLILGAALTAAGADAARAQSTGEDCVRQGHKPGTAAFYRCLQESGGSEGSSGGEGQGAEGSDSGLGAGVTDGTSTESSNSTMSGATSPDPDILKQLNSPRQPPK
jgi:hypothetical protein